MDNTSMESLKNTYTIGLEELNILITDYYEKIGRIVKPRFNYSVNYKTNEVFFQCYITEAIKDTRTGSISSYDYRLSFDEIRKIIKQIIADEGLTLIDFVSDACSEKVRDKNNPRSSKHVIVNRTFTITEQGKRKKSVKSKIFNSKKNN